MPVPSSIADLSQTAGSNYPAASENPNTADDYFRTHATFIATLRDGKGASAEVDVASAATADIGAANSPFVRVTGTTTITSFGTNYNGPRFIRFAGALTLTRNASTLVLPGGANIVTAAGDTCVATPISGGWVVSQYERASKSGTVLQEATFAVDAGTSTNLTTLTNLTASSKSITPRSANSIFIVECSFGVLVELVSGTNTTATFQLMESGSGIGSQYEHGVADGDGGNRIKTPSTVRARLTNSALTARSFTLGGLTSSTSAAVSATNQVFTIREIQA